MDVNNVMSTYNMSSLWNSLNSSFTVPLTNNIDSTVQENYATDNFLGGNTSTELQDIYKKLEPTYGIPLTYNQAGDLSVPTNTTIPENGLTPNESNIISLLNSNNSSFDNSYENLLSQYTSIENGTYSTSLSSILSSNPYAVYNSIDSFGNNSTDNLGNSIDSTI